MARRRRRHATQHADERWLLTYADMITLLMALFIVMFAISSVNTSKFESLKKALQDSFSGKIVPGGESIKEAGGSANATAASDSAPFTNFAPMPTPNQAADAGQKQAEQDEFADLKRRIDAYVKAHGLSGKVHTAIAARGLSVEILTDNLLFASGEATIQPQAAGLLHQLGGVLRVDHRHPILVEGHTDNQPIHSLLYPSNWELSGARAAIVVRTLAASGIGESRFTASGRADRDPVLSNRTDYGRRRNRRVQILLPRLNAPPAGAVPQPMPKGPSFGPSTPQIGPEAVR